MGKSKRKVTFPIALLMIIREMNQVQTILRTHHQVLLQQRGEEEEKLKKRLEKHKGRLKRKLEKLPRKQPKQRKKEGKILQQWNLKRLKRLKRTRKIRKRYPHTKTLHLTFLEKTQRSHSHC